ncbi:SDR family oxidoreductase [Acidipila sp. EB88]|uniref:SDR family oxidoreductase n=1 Tax=Acidipila sp. EB88 TaxID=2305226 RepID=UPI000F5F76FA|nr:SDR family oxidoreductase [Acidipila sp. EB88]RRA47644.1 SDR family oxidoreductase [Acidipila sp. EB88]
MIAVTGANGQLGKLVIEGLLKKVPAADIVAIVRNPETATAFQQAGVQVREADYDRPESLEVALRGADKLLLISAVMPGQRLRQHRTVIDAAKRSGVSFVAYTSMLKADTSGHVLAPEHLATEEYLAGSGLTYALLRNAWYLENHMGMVEPALQHGVLVGSAKEGRFASASRADYAGAAVAVLTGAGELNRTYELAGDTSFTMSEFASELSEQTGKQIPYNDLDPDAYRSLLSGLGLPPMIVEVVVDADVKAQQGAFDSSSSDLSRLLGHSTTTLAQAIRATVRSQQ